MEMMPELLIAAGLGVVATYATNLAKRYLPELTARETQGVVFGVCLVAAIIVSVVVKYAPEEVLLTLGGAFTTAVTWYELVKSHQK